MPNLNHRLNSAFFPIFSSQKSAFFPPFFLPNPNGRLGWTWQNSRNSARRMALRTMGFLVALFSTARANAYYITSACPGCSGYGGSICDNNGSKYEYNDGTGIGTVMMSCISTSTTGAIMDSACVNQLKSWGMCNTSSYGVYYLDYSGLSCAGSGSTAGTGWFTGATTSYNTASYYYSSSTNSYYSASGYTAIRMTSYSTGALYLYAVCTIEENDQVVESGAHCCFTNNSTLGLEDWIYCGVCSSTSGYETYADVGGLTNNSSATCTTDFQTYFSTGLSSGYCSGNTIYVEGTGALLIAQACYGTTSINNNLTNVFCGVLITSCNGASGFYHNGLSADPKTFASNGSAYWCKLCPDGENNNIGITGTGVLNVKSSGTGITSCYGTPVTNPVTSSDTKGTYQIQIGSTCPYSE